MNRAARARTSVAFSDCENGLLNPFCTEWKYLSVRRTALFIVESLYRGMQWDVFEPNDEPMRIRFGSSSEHSFRTCF